jgi:hypothetical protein
MLDIATIDIVIASDALVRLDEKLIDGRRAAVLPQAARG